MDSSSVQAYTLKQKQPFKYASGTFCAAFSVTVAKNTFFFCERKKTFPHTYHVLIYYLGTGTGLK